MIQQSSESADIALTQLNKALKELYEWCLENRLTPHPGKSEIMILSKKNIMGPLPSVSKHVCWF